MMLMGENQAVLTAEEDEGHQVEETPWGAEEPPPGPVVRNLCIGRGMGCAARTGDLTVD